MASSQKTMPSIAPFPPFLYALALVTSHELVDNIQTFMACFALNETLYYKGVDGDIISKGV
jgi:hypothetical protein